MIAGMSGSHGITTGPAPIVTTMVRGFAAATAEINAPCVPGRVRASASIDSPVRRPASTSATSQSATSAAVCAIRSSGWRQPSSRWGSTCVPGIEMATLVLYSTRSATACPAARSATEWSG
jgi:hypothetical protein